MISNGDAIIQVAEIRLKGPSTVSINAGTGSSGAFGVDAYFSGGSTNSTTSAIDVTGVPNAAPQQVYQTERYNGTTLTYTVTNLGANANYYDWHV